MRAEYEITPEDLYAFQWRAATESPRARRASRNAYLGWFIALFLFSIVPAIGPRGFTVSDVSWTFLVVGFVVISVAQWLLFRWLTRRAILSLLKEEKPDAGQLGTHALELDDTGLVESTVVGQSRTSWAGVNRVEQNEKYIYIYTSPVGAHIIPKRAFTTADAADGFYRTASERAANRSV
ncbi:MAG: YcxB family protein [Gemmatimonadales bacterium]